MKKEVKTEVAKEEKRYTSTNSPDIYEVWHGILFRANDPRWTAKFPTYIGTTVCDEWKDFKTFAKWYDENRYDIGEKLDIDKDLMVDGNKRYSPETCLILPHKINVFLAKTGVKRTKNDLPDGVHISGRKYQVMTKFNRKFIHIGMFSDPVTAGIAYKVAKLNLFLDLIKSYEGKLPEKVMKALYDKYHRMDMEIGQ